MENTAKIENLQAKSTMDEPQPLRAFVEQALENYFNSLDGKLGSGVYELVNSEVEAPLLEVVMKYTKDNQSRAAIVLGISRGTLRKKLKKYGLL